MTKKLILLTLLFSGILATSLAHHHPANHILVLHSYHPSFRWNYEMSQGIISTLDKGLVEYHLVQEYMDTKRLFDEIHQQKLRKLYAHKYAGVSFDLVIATDDDALRFLMEYGDELFPGVPVVFCGINDYPEGLKHQKPHFTGVLEELDINATVSLALRLFPQTRTVYFVGDQSTTAFDLSRIFRNRHENDFPGITFQYIHKSNLDDVKKKISEVPLDAIVMLWPYLNQEDNRLVEVEYATRLISASSPVPVFGFWQFMLGHGIVGGKLVSGKTQGENAAKIALRILMGEHPQEIAVKEFVPNEYFFDYQILRKFNISKRDLPANSIIINEPTDFVLANKKIITGFLITLILFLVIFLVNQINQKRIQKILKQELTFQQALINALPNPVFYSLDNVYIHGANHAFRDVSGIKDMGQPPQELYSLYPPGQVDQHKKINREVLLSRRPVAYEGQLVNKQGKLQDVIFYKSAFFNRSTRKYGIIETIVDISEKKKQTEMIRLSEERYTLATRATLDGIWDWNLKEKNLFVSERLNEMLNYAPKQKVFTHDNFNQYIHPDDTNIFNHQIDLLKEEKRNHCLLEVRMKKQDGSWLWVEMNILGLSHKGGNIYRVVGSVSDIQKRKDTKLVLTKLEEIFNNTLMGVVVVNPETGIMELMNPVFARMHGFTTVELTKKTIDEIIEGEPGFDSIASVAINEGHHVAEAMHKRKDGSLFPVMIDITAARNNRGELIYFIINLQDITERKNQQNLIAQMLQNEQSMNEELRSSEEEVRQSLQETVKLKDRLEESHKQFLSFINGTSDFVFLKDKDLRYLMVNEAFAAFHKLSVDNIIGRTDSDITSLHIAEIEKSNDEKILNENKYIIYEREVNGLFFETRKFPVVYENNLIGVGAFIRNVTAQRIVERKVRENELRFKTLLENSFELITLTDSDGIISWSTDAIEKIAGVNNKDAIGKHITQFFHPEDRSFFMQKMERIVSHPSEHVYIQHRIKHTDGSTKSIETIAINHLDNPLINSVVFTSRDVSIEVQSRELKKNITIAQKSAEIKQQFLANMSHEIRTPMSGILGMIEFLMQTNLDETQSDYVATIKSSADSLLNIINDILDFSKIEAGKLIIKPVPVNIRNFIADAPKIFAALVKQKNLDFKIFVDNSLPEYVNLDPMRLNQVISNLLSNAIKFTSRGEVSLRVYPEKITTNELTLRFEVKDTGIGISQQEQNKLFSPFTQIDSSLTRSQEGTGLGLAISQRIIELMDGEIGVISEPEKGSLFWFTVPYTISENDKLNLLARDIQPGKRQKLNLNILLVEDKVINQKVIRLLLESLGCKTTIAQNGKEAIDLIEKYHSESKKQNNAPEAGWDIILMDIQMPVMDGITATGIIRRKYPEYPVIIGLSANVFIEEVETYLQSGLDDYIAKPAKSEDLYKKLLLWSDRKKNMIPQENEALHPILEALKKERIFEANSLDVIKQQSENNTLVLKELFSAFYNDTMGMIENIRTIAKRDETSAGPLLQTLRTMAQSMGAIQLEKAAQAMEENILRPSIPNESLLSFMEMAAKTYLDEVLWKT